MKKKYQKKRNGLIIRNHFPTTSVMRREHGGIKVKDITSDEKIIAESIIIPESSATPGGSVTVGFLDVEKLIEFKQGRKKRVVYLEKILPFQVLELGMPGKSGRTKTDDFEE